VAISICLALGVAEGLTRLFFPAFDPSGQYAFDYRVGDLRLATPGAIARQKKNTGDFDVTVRINRLGLRDDKDASRATGDDIIVVGNSYAWGWGVEASQRFSDLVQAKTGIRVFNVTVPGDLETDLELLRYVRTLGAAPPRLAIVAVGLEYDIHVYGAPPAVEATDEVPSVRGWLSDRRLAFSHWLAGRSAAYVLALTAIHQTPWLNALGVRLGMIVPNFAGMSENVYAPEKIDTSVRLLQQIAQSQKTLVVLIPSRGLWVGSERADEDKTHRALVTALRDRGIDVLDLRAAFEAGGAPLQYHFANDGHWNERGHALAADAIAARLGF
jgi:hypothetical protein